MINLASIYKTVLSWILVCCLLATADAGPFNRIIVFGDSLSDTGNIHDLIGVIPLSPPNFEGRFSNGPVWIERLAELLELPPPTPSRQGGTNYAHGSAPTGEGFVTFVVPRLGTQVSRFLDDSAPREDDLLVVWGGANDLFDDLSVDPTVPVSNLADHITLLAAEGGQKFLVPNLPLLGRSPDFLGTSDGDRLNQLTSQFNQQLSDSLDNLTESLDISITQFDTFSLFRSLLNDPQSFGFSNVTEPALVGVNVVANPEEYLFWDEFHPTAAAHRILGEAVTAQLLVPEPDSIYIVSCGMLGLLFYAYVRESARNGSGK